MLESELKSRVLICAYFVSVSYPKFTAVTILPVSLTSIFHIKILLSVSGLLMEAHLCSKMMIQKEALKTVARQETLPC